MGTIVNLNLGGTGSGVSGTTGLSLILQSPYTEPSGRLLVLRSAPDVAPVTSTVVATARNDTGLFEGTRHAIADPRTSTLVISGKPDVGEFQAHVVVPAVTSTFNGAERRDTGLVSGSFDGLATRRATLNATSRLDTAVFAATYTIKVRGVADATEQGDVGAFTGIALDAPKAFWNTTEKRDTGAFSAYSLYDVSSELVGVDNADSALFAGRTHQRDEVEVADVVRFSDVLEGTTDSALYTRAVFSDLLDAVQDTFLRTTAHWTDTVQSVLRLTGAQVDTLGFSDVLTAHVTGVTTDVVVFGDILEGLVTPVGEGDTVVFTDVLASQLAITGLLEDAWGWQDVVATELYGESSDSLVFSDDLQSDVSSGSALTDAVQFADALSGVLAVSGSRTDTVLFTDSIDAIALASAAETLIFADVLEGQVATYAPELVDTVGFVDTLFGTTAVYAPLLSDTGVWVDALSSTLSLVGVLSDTVLWGDSLGEAAQIIHVVNADTGAVSTYTFTPSIVGMTEYRGVLYLAGPDGLYALDAETDSGAGIVWTLRTGFSNLDTDKLKRVQDINVLARVQGDTTFQVVTNRTGKKQEWNYRLPPLTRESHRDGVIQPGMGVTSVYWQFAFKGVAPAEINQLRLVVTPLSRRR